MWVFFSVEILSGVINRDNNLGMWSRGPESEGDGGSEFGLVYSDDMSGGGGAVLPLRSFPFTLGMCFLSWKIIIPLTFIL